MKLSDIKKNADAKAAEVEAAWKHAQLMAELDVHPLLKRVSARDVRDAYFCGDVFGALTDDVEIDENEQLSAHIASKIGRDLNQFIDKGLFYALCRVVRSGRDFRCGDLLKLSNWLGEDATRYLMLDVFKDDVKPILDAQRWD